MRVPSIAAVYEKYLPKLRDVIAEQKLELIGDDSEPSLDWVFIRKHAGTAFETGVASFILFAELT